MKIDIHTHIMPEHMPNWTQKFGYGEFIHLEHRNCQACMMKGDKLFRVVEEDTFFSILPTATQYARNALFSGLLPIDIEK